MLSLKIVLNTPSFPFNPKKEYKACQFLWKGKDCVHCTLLQGTGTIPLCGAKLTTLNNCSQAGTRTSIY